MARGKAKAAKTKAPPRKIFKRHYVCTLHNRHHGAFTKIGIADRRYAREAKG